MPEITSEKGKVGIALSGGGSRAIAFHYGVIEALRTLRVDSKIDVISAISGGAVVGALWALHFNDWNSFSKKIEWILANGFEKELLRHIFSLNRIFRLLKLGIDADEFGEVLDRRIFGGIKLADMPAHPLLILNAAELKEGVNFKLSKNLCGSYKDGNFPLPNLRLSQAVAYSAAYPLFFSVKKLLAPNQKNVFLTDGGAYDCIGANALMPDKDSKSILVQKCDTVIISDASFPYYIDQSRLALSVIDGLYASHLTSSHRNRSLIYNKLFLLNKAQEIPFLGVIKMDSEHPDLTKGWNREDLALINKYKTDFKPVEGKALDALKDRGRRVAELIVRQYLAHLL
jgi:NTE family protein